MNGTANNGTGNFYGNISQILRTRSRVAQAAAVIPDDSENSSNNNPIVIIITITLGSLFMIGAVSTLLYRRRFLTGSKLLSNFDRVYIF